MHRTTLARTRLDGAGWAHPYPTGRFDPFLYADGGNPVEPGQQPTGGAPTPVPQAPETPAASPWDGFQWDGKVDSLPDPVARVIREAREEAGKSRTVAKQNAAEEARRELLASISKAVGLDSGEKPPTPEELTQQLTQSQTERTVAQEDAAAARIELHVYKAAARLGANADALLDSRAFCDTIDALDPSAGPDAFNAAVQQAIETALHNNPSLRAYSAGRSGGDFGGSGGSGDQPSIDKQIEEATARRDFPTAIRLKRQKAAQTR